MTPTAVMGVVFDLDNTLAHLEHLPEEFTSNVLGPIVNARKNREPSLEKEIRLSFFTKPFSELKTEFALSDQEYQTAIQTMKYMADLAATGVYPYDDMVPTLAAIRELGFRMALLTRGVKELQEAKIRRLRLIDYFRDEIYIDDISQNEGGIGKKAILVSIACGWKLEPPNIAVVGDDPNSELKAASELGMKAIEIMRKAPQSGVEGSYIAVKSLTEFMSWLMLRSRT
jgi:putative hydrolase of the HAD superfamily